MGGLAEVEGFSGWQVVDARDVAVVDEAAEAGFEEIEVVEAFPGHACGDGCVGHAEAQVEGGVHRLVRERVG